MEYMDRFVLFVRIVLLDTNPKATHVEEENKNKHLVLGHID